MKRRFPQTAVILIRETAAPSLLHLAMRAGIRDVVDLSRGTDELRHALDESLAWARSLRTTATDWARPLPTRRGPIVGVFSSKGGTGKSFLASNLAAAMAAGRRSDTALLEKSHRNVLFSLSLDQATATATDLVRLSPEWDAVARPT